LKNGKTVKIRCNDEVVANEVLTFIAQSESQMLGFLDQRLRSTGYGETDTVIDINQPNLYVKVSARPEDKGQVQILKDGALVEVPYSEVENEGFYLYIQDGKTVIMHKFSDPEVVDKKVGLIKSLSVIKEHLEALPEHYANMVKAQEEAVAAAAAEAETAPDSPMEDDIEEAEVLEEVVMEPMTNEETVTDAEPVEAEEADVAVEDVVEEMETIEEVETVVEEDATEE